MKFRRRNPKRSPPSPLSSGEEEQFEEDRIFIRKGPWKAEEDEILLKHVNKYGPRDWSSLLSKGLLRRTGKSCRLRWVNKLRPNLKSGCKFSAEEQRIVIELQSQLGNKWAKIATYLPGRTDNDVKNFWSSRQKRLARLLRSQSQNSKSKPNTTITNFISSSLEASNHGSQIGESSSYYSALVEPSNSLGFSPNNITSTQVISCQNLTPFNQKKSTESIDLELQKVSLPESQSEFQLLSPKAEEELIRTLDLDFMGEFAKSIVPLPLEMPYSGPVQTLSFCKREQSSVEIKEEKWSTFLDQEPVAPDILFDDLPSDILDQIELGW